MRSNQTIAICVILFLSVLAIGINELRIAGFVSFNAGKFIALAIMALNFGFAFSAARQAHRLVCHFIFWYPLQLFLLISAATPISAIPLLLRLL
jgi:hypothetical protein